LYRIVKAVFCGQNKKQTSKRAAEIIDGLRARKEQEKKLMWHEFAFSSFCRISRVFFALRWQLRGEHYTKSINDGFLKHKSEGCTFYLCVCFLEEQESSEKRKVSDFAMPRQSWYVRVLFCLEAKKGLPGGFCQLNQRTGGEG
jgi:hypothetical protein